MIDRAVVVLLSWVTAGAAMPGLAALPTAFAPRVSAQAPGVKAIDDLESYAAYSALLPDAAMLQMRRSMIVIQAEATTAPQCWPSGPPMETDWKSNLERLRAENAHARTILPGFALSVPYIVLSKADVKAAFTGDPIDWKPFYNRYPDSAGYLQLSAVGFDADQTKAILYLGHSYNNMGGEYSYHLLQKVAGRWQDTRVPGVNTCASMA
jgi:hypothetical protein